MKNKIYCIWELDKKWNYKKDRLCSEFKSSEIGKHEEEFDIDINNDRYINSYLIRENSSIKNNTNRLYAFKFKINPIKFEKNNFIINAKVNSINNKNSELNIKLTKTGDQISDTFPSSISLSCGSKFESCTPFKTGRFNNLWRIWIKNINSYESIEFATEEIKRNPPSFWPIQYLTFKS